jgi:hypothetical protein
VCVTSIITDGPDLRLRPLLMSIHGVAFTVTDGTIYFIFHLVEVTRTIHIITVTLLHIVHLVTEALLLPSSLPHLSHGHIWDIVLPPIHRPLRWIKQMLKSSRPMSSPQQIASSTVTFGYSPHVAHVAYDTRLLHGSKEDEAILVLYMYNSPHRQSPLEICDFLISHH